MIATRRWTCTYCTTTIDPGTVFDIVSGDFFCENCLDDGRHLVETPTMPVAPAFAPPLPEHLSPRYRALAAKATARHNQPLYLVGNSKDWLDCFTFNHRGRLVFWYNTRRPDGKEDTHCIAE
jgi:hypothetical protein